MNILKQSVALIFVAGLVLGAWSLTATAADNPAASSGFLDASVEAKLKKTRLQSGRHVERWMSPDFNGKKYHAIMVDRVIYYPAPHPGPEISSSTLDAITDHLTYTLKSRLGKGVSVVDKGGPGVLRMQPAVTAVSVKKQGMSAADIIPIHLLFSAAKSASGSSDYETRAQLEVRITDSVSHTNVAAAKMDLKGKNINKGAALSLADVQKVLDEAAADGAETIISHM